jgi:hypothetical protein
MIATMGYGWVDARQRFGMVLVYTSSVLRAAAVDRCRRSVAYKRLHQRASARGMLPHPHKLTL